MLAHARPARSGRGRPPTERPPWLRSWGSRSPWRWRTARLQPSRCERGDPATAASRALAAAAAADEVGARVEAARSRTLAGRAFACADERELAVAELERAVQQLDLCGAMRYRQEAERELRKLGRHIHHRTRPGNVNGAGVETLTQREVQVADLVVDRRTNPEIASELFLSVKTIETHLRSIFRKLDVSSRYDVARVMERRSEGSPPPTT